MIFHKTAGTNLIFLKSQTVAANLPFEFDSREIALNAHSALEAVVFMAKISNGLAAEGMGVNPVAGFNHDHIFVPDGREHDALRVLAKMTKDANA